MQWHYRDILRTIETDANITLSNLVDLVILYEMKVFLDKVNSQMCAGLFSLKQVDVDKLRLL